VNPVRKSLLLILVLLLTALCACAAAGSEYPLESISGRVSVNEDRYIVLTPGNLAEHPDLLSSIGKTAEELQAALPELRIACVHGRMKPKEKDAVMDGFTRGETDVLVSTTVIEVGVDVPNATLMIVENAERFGLSQLHQLRGRVGRGRDKSYCVLVSDAQNEEAKARLGILCETNDGFRIAEEDLRLRGPGDFFGARQHGLPEMHIAHLGADTGILKAAKAEADAIFASDPLLERAEHAALRKRVESIQLAISN
jgi:ATP-dependent DNA helicase RecG